MPKFIKIKDFAAEFIKQSLPYGELRLISIGTSRDGYYVFRCKDKTNQEIKIRIPCWDTTETKGA